MIREKFAYLFGNKYGRMLSREKLAPVFCPDDPDVSISDIQQDVRRIAFYTREKEKEEYRLARLPLITNQTSEEAPEFISAEKVQMISNIIDELYSSLIAMLPKVCTSRMIDDSEKVKTTIPNRYCLIFDSAIRFAVQYRVLEQIKQLHCESCESLIAKYSKEEKTEKIVKLQQIQYDLTIEYDEKINTAKNSAFQKISRFILALSRKPMWNRFSGIQYADHVLVVYAKKESQSECLFHVKAYRSRRVYPKAEKKSLFDKLCLSTAKFKMKPVGKK